MVVLHADGGNTIKGHVELAVKPKGLYIDTIKQNYIIWEAWTIFKNFFNVFYHYKIFNNDEDGLKHLIHFIGFSFSHLWEDTIIYQIRILIHFYFGLTYHLCFV